ncbi:MAG: aminotransferase class I/II-fold pyridoxal phosphate-dependent enzyme [Rectinemataceae bacterium]|nr:aminotransferase class I/II-fold pyridoxal phosphate-dependent enzyme [Rectinemataceae bacterium]
MNILAEELNNTLAGTVAGRLLSDMGRRMYFPKGILTQSAEAGQKAHRFNATVGMAYTHGEPMILDAIRNGMPALTPYEAVSYAPTSGVQAVRECWEKALMTKNPSLSGNVYSLPVVVPGLTAAVSYIADLFIEPGDTVVVPDLHWPNYRLIVEERKTATGLTYPIFADGGFNVPGMEARLREAGSRRGKAICILNFPNNPTGYSPTLAEAKAIVDSLCRVADEGTDLLVIADDAYFGLQYETGLFQESIFGPLSAAHDNILAVKADGPTKEDFVWGFRVGFVTFAGRGLSATHCEALTKKLGGVIRSSVSNSTAPGQYLFLKALGSPGYDEQKKTYRAILESRYRALKTWLAQNGLPDCLTALPFNSGYFMSFECSGISAETLRIKLLDEKGIGTISMQDKYLRVAFSSVEAEDIPELCTEISAAAAWLASAKSGH